MVQSATNELERVRRMLLLQSKEMRKLRELARTILEQRTELEQVPAHYHNHYHNHLLPLFLVSQMPWHGHCYTITTNVFTNVFA